MNFFKRLLQKFRKQKVEPQPTVQQPLPGVAPPAWTPPVVVGAPVGTPTPAPVTPPSVTPPGATPGWPRVLERGGARFMADEWVAEDWLPSMEAIVLTSQGQTVGFDPSNAPAGYPKRSKAGYPLFYAIGGDGKPVGTPRVLFNGVTLENDAAVPVYVAEVAQRDANLKEWQRLWNKVYYLGKGLKAADLTMDDRVWLYRMAYDYFTLVNAYKTRTGKFAVHDLHRVVLEGFNVDINRCINDGAYNGGETLDPATSTYAGPCKAVVEAAFAAVKADAPWDAQYDMRDGAK